MSNAFAIDIKNRLEKPVVLIGMMGSGKSHVGRVLSDALGVAFSDTDKEIESRAGCSIPEIFERDGEEKFRESEKRVVEDMLSGDIRVIATGGGAITNADTAEAIWTKSLSIWLKADISVLMDRLKDKKDRPLLACGGPHEILEKLLAERQPIYQRAHIIVDSGTEQVDQCVQGVLQAIHDYLYGDEKQS